MLSRTADHLFWMSRYTERAENTARLLSVNHDMGLLPQSSAAARRGWEGVLSLSELRPAYAARHGSVNASAVMHFMLQDEDNPASIIACLKAARENARAVRGALTSEVWETLNQTWLEAARLCRNGPLGTQAQAASFLEWVKFRSHLSRGVTLGTMLQNEAFHFLRLGTFLERADNTARLLDVKFHAAPGEAISPAAQAADGADDYYHWAAILRSVSAFEVYRQAYRDVITPERVAELLILHGHMPRSLHHCMRGVVEQLRLLQAAPQDEAVRQAGRMRADLRYGQIDEILQTGLHAFLTQFLERVNRLGQQISRSFLIPPA